MANLNDTDFIKARMDSKHIIMTVSEYWPSWSDSVLLFIRSWLRKVQEVSKGKVQLSYLDTSGPMDCRIGAKGGFGSWNEEKQYVDIVASATTRYFECLQPVFKINYLFRWFLYGTDIRGATRAYHYCMKEIPAVSDEFTTQGMKYLWGLGALPLCIQTKDKQVKSLADIKGLKLSGEGPRLYPGLFESMGAEMVYLDLTDATAEDFECFEYMHTRKGIADGNVSLTEFLGPKTMNGSKIVKYVAFLDIPTQPKDFYLMNLNVWNNLPEDVKDCFNKCSEWAREEIIKTFESVTQEAMDYAKSLGVQFTYLSKADQKKFNDYLEKTALQKVEELNKDGIPGTKIFQTAREYIEKYEATKKPLKTWQGLKY